MMNFICKQNCIRFAQCVFVILSTFLMTLSAVAGEDNNRYQATVLHEGGQGNQFGKLLPKVFIIDSKDGHMWILDHNSKLHNPKKGSFALGSVLTYQGRVRPGKKMGEVIEQAESW
ncbi:MAG: hypothetical protein GQ583_01020 [Methyloprofundus sp.]|nr:hypothetical protein [Methyloprofundus sp.]